MSVPATLRTLGEPLARPSQIARRRALLGFLVIAVILGCLLGYLFVSSDKGLAASCTADPACLKNADELRSQFAEARLERKARAYLREADKNASGK